MAFRCLKTPISFAARAKAASITSAGYHPHLYAQKVEFSTCRQIQWNLVPDRKNSVFRPESVILRTARCGLAMGLCPLAAVLHDLFPLHVCGCYLPHLTATGSAAQGYFLAMRA